MGENALLRLHAYEKLAVLASTGMRQCETEKTNRGFLALVLNRQESSAGVSRAWMGNERTRRDGSWTLWHCRSSGS